MVKNVRKLEQILNILLYNSEATLLYRKEDKTYFKNYKGICVLSDLCWLLNKLDFYKLVDHDGYRKKFSTTDNLSTVGTLIVKCFEHNIPHQVALLDFQKTSESIEIWAVYLRLLIGGPLAFILALYLSRVFFKISLEYV